MKQNIILRNLPKEKIQIDIWPFKIQGGFRGFQQVPNGLHYIAVLFHNIYPGFWCFVEGATVVKAFNSEKSQFIDADNETTTTYQAQADSGAMNKDLIVFPKAAELQWHRLTSHISPKNYDQIVSLTPSSPYQVLLSLAGMVVVGLALGASFGLCFYVGLSLNDVCPIIPFLLLGIGQFDQASFYLQFRCG